MDRLTPEQRHKNMQSIKNRDSQIEILLRKELSRRGLRYRKNVKTVFGHPDVAFIGKKIAVFCDSEFWHGYDWENKKLNIKSNQNFWYTKIERNMARDEEVNSKLRTQGWIVLRFWGEEIKKDVAQCADIIETEYNKKCQKANK